MSEYNDVTPLIFGRPAAGAAAEPETDDAGLAPEPAAADDLDGEDADADRSEVPGADLASEPSAVGALDDEDAEFTEDAVEDTATHEEPEPEPEPSGELQLDLSSPAAEQPSTYGHPEVDAVVERLEELDYLETADHVEVFEDAHHRLHETLLAAGDERAGNTDGAAPPGSA